MSVFQEIMEAHPVRKSAAQKAAFRAWAMERLGGMGYDVKVEGGKRDRHYNLICGDPERAAVVFCAHYDTPARMLLPDLIIPRNPAVGFAYLLLNLLLLFIPSMAALVLVQGFTGQPRLALLAFAAMFFALIMLETRGPANPANANDNTSGLAALMQLMEQLPAQARGRVAFILFDDCEKGRLGSKAFARSHMQVQFTRLTVCLDSVGVGEELLCVSSELARKCTGYGALESALKQLPGMTPHFVSSRGTLANGDHQSFKCGVLLMACKTMPGVGLYTPMLHTPADRTCSEDNLSSLAGTLGTYVRSILRIAETDAENAAEK